MAAIDIAGGLGAGLANLAEAMVLVVVFEAALEARRRNRASNARDPRRGTAGRQWRLSSTQPRIDGGSAKQLGPHAIAADDDAALAMEGAQIVAAREESARPDAVIGGLTRSAGPNDQFCCTAAAQTSRSSACGRRTSALPPAFGPACRQVGVVQRRPASSAGGPAYVLELPHVT